MIENKDPRRPVSGVVIGSDRQVKLAPADTVVHCLPIEMFAVSYGDGDGRAHETVFVRFNGNWFEARNSEEWMGGLRPVLAKFSKQLDQLSAASKDKSVPKTDSVDIMG